MKAKMEAESKALQEKLDKEATALKDKLTEGEEARRKESKALQDKLEKEKEALAKQVFKSEKNSSLFKLHQKAHLKVECFGCSSLYVVDKGF